MAPAAHTCIGGVTIDQNAATTIPGLFAAGEAAGGIHGANRIGGCAGSETLVFGKIAGASAARYAAGRYSEEAPPMPERFRTVLGSVGETRADLQIERLSARETQAVQKGLGMIKDAESLKTLIAELEQCQTELLAVPAENISVLRQKIKLENILLTAQMQARASLLREESRGVFFRSDFPVERKSWETNIIIQCRHGNMTLHVE